MIGEKDGKCSEDQRNITGSGVREATCNIYLSWLASIYPDRLLEFTDSFNRLRKYEIGQNLLVFYV